MKNKTKLIRVWEKYYILPSTSYEFIKLYEKNPKRAKELLKTHLDNINNYYHKSYDETTIHKITQILMR